MLFHPGSLPPLAIVAFVLVTGCKLPDSVEEGTLVTNLRFTPSAFDSFTTNTEIRYALGMPADVTLSIVRRDGAGRDQLVNTLCTDLYESKGIHAHTWLGDTPSGIFAPAGEYVGILSVRGHQFESTVRVFHY